MTAHHLARTWATCPGSLPQGIMVAVSGGADSVALLLALVESRGDHGLPLAVCHVNHQLRGGASEADASWVEALSERLGLPIFREDVDVRKAAAEQGVSVELAAREARRSVWRRMLATHEGWAVALGHHADDQAETLLLRLGRGSSLRGMGGMRTWTRENGFWLVRPMLHARKSDLVRGLEERGQDWREDASNEEEAFTRNRLRHSVLPGYSEALERDVVPGLLRTSQLMQEDEEVLAALAREQGAALASSVGLDWKGCCVLPRSVRRRVLFAWLEKQKLKPSLRTLAPWLEGQSHPPSVDFGAGGRLQQAHGVARVVPTDGEEASGSFCYTLPEPGTVLCVAEAGWTMRVTRVGQRVPGLARGPGKWPASACLPVPSPEGGAGAPLWVRSWVPGDRYQPIGLTGGSKKLQDVFTDAKIPAVDRWRIPVVGCGDAIWWVAGGEVAVPAAVGEGDACLQVVVEGTL